jgi:hypothetical protein
MEVFVVNEAGFKLPSVLLLISPTAIFLQLAAEQN